ncbi:MAG: FKBP-type peptidyl-prolyl cis-trans isomerase [Mariprofundaceae bacterium]|nr:FKBP-type peptidyl-prolyl cis-trans isomerase [Mariprofundaceae bacterium]
MKKLILLGTIVLGLAACSQGQAPEDKPVALDSDTNKLGYAMGMDAGNFFRQLTNDADADAFVEAFSAAVAGKEMRMKPEEAGQVKQAFAQRKQQEKQVVAEANKSSGMAFLETNKQKSGITTTSSGLQYEVLRAAEGNRPVATDMVKVHYKGTLIDGTEFDSSYARGEPATFPLNAVIPGWGEGLQLMNVGSKYRLFVPSELAYGERGAGAKIGPNTTLIFDVELLEIVKK